MDYFALFIQMLEAKGLTDNTIRSYKTYIKAYLNYLSSLHILPEDASWQMIRDFVAWIQKSRDLDDHTVNATISQLQFFQIYVLHKEWDRTQVPFRKFDCYLPFVPSKEQVCAFINALDDPDARLAAAIIYATGLRIDELCHLKYTDIHRSSHKLYIHHSKNRQDRYVPFTELIWEALLNRWLSFPAGTRPHGWIFTRRRDTSQPMYKQWLQREFRICRDALGMDERFCEHSAEIEAYEEAVKYLKANYPEGLFPSMKSLKERKEKLLKLQKSQQETYKYYKESKKDFRTVCSNVDSILGQGRTLNSEQKQSQSLS